MTVRVLITAPDLPALRRGVFDERLKEMAAIGVTAGVAAAAEGLKTDLRRAVTDAGLGDNLANAIGSNVYPRPGRHSMSAAGAVFARGNSADRVLTAHAQGATIRPHGRRYVAIPTESVPVANRRRMTPAELERAVGHELRFVRNKKGGKAAGFLFLDNVVRGRGRRVRWRSRQAVRARNAKSESVLMFILVREVRLRPRFDMYALAEKWAELAPQLAAEALDRVTP